MQDPKETLNVHPPAADELTVDQALESIPRGDKVEDHVEYEVPDDTSESAPDTLDSI